MSDGSLSQDEIDALLQGGGGFDFGDAEEQPSADESGGGGLSDQEQGALAAVLRGMTGSLESNLSGLVGSGVSISGPEIEIVSNGSFVSSLPGEIVQIRVGFTGEAEGDHSFIFTPEIATSIAGLMMGQEDVELNDAALSALEEAGNTLAGAEATAISEQVGGDVGTSTSESRSAANEDVEVPSGPFVKASYKVTIEGQTPADLIEVFDMNVVRQITGGGAAGAQQKQQQQQQQPQQAAPSGGQAQGGGGMDFGGQQGFMQQGQNLGQGFGQNQPNVQSVQFPSLGQGSGGQEEGNISLLMDVYMEMTVELGRTKKLIRDILGMGEGTIIELDKLAGEPVDILVNHKLIAKGEVVVIDENFGVRVTEIVDQMDRVPEM